MLAAKNFYLGNIQGIFEITELSGWRSRDCDQTGTNKKAVKKIKAAISTIAAPDDILA